MSTFTNKAFQKYDDYMTPKSAWEDIKQYIPRDKVIWECFYGNGNSGRYLTELGFNVIHEEIDFYENDLGEILLSNPPYSDIKNVMKRLSELDKPFIMLMPSSKINTQYFRENFKNRGIQIIIPSKRIHFLKLVNGEVPKNWKNACNFDCFYYCYKLGLPNDIIWLN
jgi:hypothetical protein